MAANGSAALPSLPDLLALFYEAPAAFGECTAVASAAVPEPFRHLLDHHEHMTEVMEAFHRSPVTVQVLAWHQAGPFYSRKILLHRQSDGRVVQFGIVRLNFDRIDPEVRREIEARQRPLGRVLIEHNVLRTVRLSQLWRIEPGPDLLNLFGLVRPAATYGRTALIFTGESPTVELLEVVTPT